MRWLMEPWIIEELQRQEEEIRRRQYKKHREHIQIDAPDYPYPDDGASEKDADRGVVIIEL
jgi:hypothetical protein